MKSTDLIPIGEIARRTGLSVSAIRFYEARGLVTSLRSHGNQRRFARGDIRRLSFILIAQKLGLGLAEIEAELARLPQGRTPTLADWRKISASMREQLDARIALLVRTRQKLALPALQQGRCGRSRGRGGAAVRAGLSVGVPGACGCHDRGDECAPRQPAQQVAAVQVQQCAIDARDPPDHRIASIDRGECAEIRAQRQQ
jgi:MerR family redox-sensitive transcriptional activator SoxR